MVIFVLQNLALLLLGGLGVYVVRASVRLERQPFAQRLLVGVVLGVVVLLLATGSFMLPVFDVPLDAKTGPLILAGYLGGPAGGAAAAIIGSIGRAWIGGPYSALGIGVGVSYVAAGVIVGYIRPPRRWPDISRTAIILCISAYLIIVFGTVLLAYSQLPINAPVATTPLVITVGLFGIFSIIVMAFFVRSADRFAEDARQVRELGNRLSLATRSAGLGVFVRDVGSDHAYFDEGMVALYGVPRKPGMVRVSEWLSVIHPDDRKRLTESLSAVWSGRASPAFLEFRSIREDGSTRYIRATLTIERDRDGEVLRVVGIHADMSDIRESQSRQLIAEARLARIAANIPGVLISLDMEEGQDPKVVYISERCRDLWEYSANEIIADTNLLVQAHDPEDYPQMLDFLKQAARDLTPFSRRYWITTPSGVVKCLETHSSPTRLSADTVRIDGVVLDVTSEVEAQRQLEKQFAVAHRAQKHESIGQLTGGVAHDFNNLLAVIMGNLELLRDELEDEDQIELVDAGINATLRGAELTRNMLAFARRARLDPKVVDLNLIVRETKNWAGRTLPASIDVETSLLAGLWKINADVSSIESALLNLFLNSRDAMPLGGKLTIETANVRIDEDYVDARQEELLPGRYVLLAVSDSGTGIPREVIRSIFEPFFSTKGPGKGSGLGLSMVQGFMRQSGGTVQVYSEPGIGTTFKLYFPAHADVSEPGTDDRTSGFRPDADGRRILLVEDEKDVLLVLISMLEREGYSVTAVGSGDEARVIFEADPDYDLLLTDIVMPGELQGTTLSRVLRELRPDLPVVFMSGYASEATVHGNGLRHEDIRLMKPVQRAEILAAIGKSLMQAGKKGR